MTTPEPRYAVYFVPAAETELFQFGAAVLGYDVYTGRNVSFIAAASPDWPNKTREPRAYGFHATLKAPLRLAEGMAPSDLNSALDAFAQSRQSIDVGPLEVRALGSFVALVPAAPCSALDLLASACVRHFDRFRAPLNGQERERRMAASLTERQKSNIERWGYPYVFEDFRFHMTLTGPLPDHDRMRALQWLTTEFNSRPAAQRLVLNSLVIARQAGGTFCVVHSAPFGA